jgi:hypothetical protein
MKDMKKSFHHEDHEGHEEELSPRRHEGNQFDRQASALMQAMSVAGGRAAGGRGPLMSIREAR